MQQTDDKRQQATAELAAREEELAKALKHAEGLGRNGANGKREQAPAEPPAREHELADARERIERLERDEGQGYSVLMIGCVVAAIASIGLCIGAVVAVIKDQQHVTTGGTIAAISAGVLFATIFTALIVRFYRQRVAPAPDEAPAASKP